PGAVNAPWSDELPDLPEGELVAYCGSGVTACVTLHRLALAGREGRLYPGSWAEWEQHEELPRERGGLRGCRRGRRASVGAEVALPATRDLGRREADEEDGRGRPRRLTQLHLDLVRQAVPLAQVAGRAGGDDVLPDRLAAARARDDVVEGQA